MFRTPPHSGSRAAYISMMKNREIKKDDEPKLFASLQKFHEAASSETKEDMLAAVSEGLRYCQDVELLRTLESGLSANQDLAHICQRACLRNPTHSFLLYVPILVQHNSSSLFLCIGKTASAKAILSSVRTRLTCFGEKGSWRAQLASALERAGRPVPLGEFASKSEMRAEVVEYIRTATPARLKILRDTIAYFRMSGDRDADSKKVKRYQVPDAQDITAEVQDIIILTAYLSLHGTESPLFESLRHTGSASLILQAIADRERALERALYLK